MSLLSQQAALSPLHGTVASFTVEDIRWARSTVARVLTFSLVPLLDL
jgi:hypothetical protein